MKLAIVILEDHPDLRVALEKDLSVLKPTVRIETVDSIPGANAAIREIVDDGDVLALILCENRLPETSGVDFLVEMMNHEDTADTRKVLVTGRTNQKDTVRAVNDAHLDHIVRKPWNPDDLVHVVREELTEYVIAKDINPLRHLQALDQVRALKGYREFSQED